MKTEQAYQAYQVQAANNTNFDNTILWILFTLLVIVPAAATLIYLFVKLASIRKCPNCGSRKTTTGTKAVGAVVDSRVSVCRACQTSF